MFHRAPRYAAHVWAEFVISKHVIMHGAMVLVARLESTSSECRTLGMQSVPVRRAHRPPVYGAGGTGSRLVFDE